MIPPERVDTNVELSQILAHLFPLLRAVRPADLNATLNALATALGGRGEQLGQTIDQLDGYLGEIDDDLPTLREDLVKLADVADTYDVAAPDLLDVLATSPRPVGPSSTGRSSACSSPTSAAWPTPRPAYSRQRTNLIRVGRGHRAGAPPARGVLARAPLPAPGRRPLRAAPGPDVRGRPGQAVPRVRHPSTARYDEDDLPRVRRGRPRPVVPRPAEPAGPDRAGQRSTRAATSTQQPAAPGRPRSPDLTSACPAVAGTGRLGVTARTRRRAAAERRRVRLARLAAHGPVVPRRRRI